MHSGIKALESTLSATNVAQLKPLFTTKLGGVADGAPAYLNAIKLANGQHVAMLFITLRNGRIAALDAYSGKPGGHTTMGRTAAKSIPATGNATRHHHL